MIIAIDGPAASGKGTLAKRLAAHFHLPHLDTGLLYRATAAAVLAKGGDLADVDMAAACAEALTPEALADEALRDRAMGEAASVVAAHGRVRDALLAMQRRFAGQAGGAVLDGRDIGTVVCPHADVKLFVTASAEERARRRARELAQRGEPSDETAILDDIRRRDDRDSHRSAAPLARAADAVLLDTTALDADAAFRAALAVVIDRRRAKA